MAGCRLIAEKIAAGAILAASLAGAHPANATGPALNTPTPTPPKPPSDRVYDDPGDTRGGGPTSNGGAQVPNMSTGAVGAPCYRWDRFIFGQGAGGQVLACVSASGVTGTWVSSAPLFGVQQRGAPCATPGGGAAQSYDGLGMVCTEHGWQPGP
jgi:hypothetical protein